MYRQWTLTHLTAFDGTQMTDDRAPRPSAKSSDCWRTSSGSRKRRRLFPQPRRIRIAAQLATWSLEKCRFASIWLDSLLRPNHAAPRI